MNWPALISSPNLEYHSQPPDLLSSVSFSCIALLQRQLQSLFSLDHFYHQIIKLQIPPTGIVEGAQCPEPILSSATLVRLHSPPASFQSTAQTSPEHQEKKIGLSLILHLDRLLHFGSLLLLCGTCAEIEAGVVI